MYMVPRMAKGRSPRPSARAHPPLVCSLATPYNGSTTPPPPTGRHRPLLRPMPLQLIHRISRCAPTPAPPFSPLQVFVLCLQLVQRAATTADAQHMSRAIRKTTHIRRNLPTRYLVEAIGALMPAGLAASFAQVSRCSNTVLCLEQALALHCSGPSLFHRPPTSRCRRSSSLLGLPLAVDRYFATEPRAHWRWLRPARTDGGC